MKATLNGGIIEISFKYDPRLIALVKTIPGRKYSVSRKTWSVPLAGSQAALGRLRAAGFEIDPALASAARQDEVVATEAAALTTMSDTEFKSPLPLFPYQRVGAAFMVRTGSCLNACGVRTGKTIMSIATVRKLGTERNLVVVPGSVLFQWGQVELQKWDRDAKVFIVYGDKRQRIGIYEEARCYSAGRFYLVLTYDVARVDIEELQKF